MTTQDALGTHLGIQHPVIQAPMAGGITTPALVAAVSNAGALGSIGAGYLTPRALRNAIRTIRERTDRPFAVNLFIPQAFEAAPERIAHANTLMQPYRDALDITPPQAIDTYAPDFDAQLDVVLEEAVPVFSFTFGVLDSTHVARLHANDTTVIGTATTVAEARELQDAGVDMVVAQGAEAGGHRGTFRHPSEQAMIGTLALVPQTVDALDIPVIASGGIMDRRGLHAAFALGATAVQMGSAFLVCEESGAAPEHKQALMAATAQQTTVTRVFSGRPGRAIANRFTTGMGPHEHALPDYPVHNAWTKDIRAAARQQGQPEYLSLWAGQAASMGQALPAAERVRQLTDAQVR